MISVLGTASVARFVPRLRARRLGVGRPLAVWFLLAASPACVPTIPPVTAPVTSTFEQKLSWILRLEDMRLLRDPEPPAPAPPVVPAGNRRPAPDAISAAAPRPDLTRLLTDGEARTRRRAALAIGRVGLAEGVVPLTTVLGNASEDEEVRQMAAFALGLLADPSGAPALVGALTDPSALVRGRAAEALGQMNQSGSAGAIGQMVAALARQPEIVALGPDDDVEPTPSATAFRLGVTALVRLKAYEPLAAAVLDPSGQPLVRWWPAAFALQRIGDPRAAPALTTFLRTGGQYGRAFAAKGLGGLKDAGALPMLLPLIEPRASNVPVAVEAIRAVAAIGDARGSVPLLTLLQTPDVDPHLRLEAMTALGSLPSREVFDVAIDFLADPWPSMRIAALATLAKADPEGFVTVLSGLDPDKHWAVRAGLAQLLGSLPPEVGLSRLMAMRADPDLRVLPAVITALSAVKPPNLEALLRDALAHEDPYVRLAAANGFGELKPARGAEALIAAYRKGAQDSTYVARAAALGALAKYGVEPSAATLREALADPEWAVRVRAAQLLRELDPASEVALAMRPAPTRHASDAYASPRLTAPPVSPHAYIDTSRGTIEIELAVLDAPLTVENFMALARRGFFEGVAVHRVVSNFVVQAGDPRGDGEGGPGFSIRDEINQRPYWRGSVGMALDWRDTGGSQFFITHSPQPHLDGRYTVFGHVVTGMDVVDRLQQWDTILRVRIWDGEQMTAR